MTYILEQIGILMRILHFNLSQQCVRRSKWQMRAMEAVLSDPPEVIVLEAVQNVKSEDSKVKKCLLIAIKSREVNLT